MKMENPKGEAALTGSLGNNVLIQLHSLWPSDYLAICKVEQPEIHTPLLGKSML